MARKIRRTSRGHQHNSYDKQLWKWMRWYGKLDATNRQADDIIASTNTILYPLSSASPPEKTARSHQDAPSQPVSMSNANHPAQSHRGGNPPKKTERDVMIAQAILDVLGSIVVEEVRRQVAQLLTQVQTNPNFGGGLSHPQNAHPHGAAPPSQPPHPLEAAPHHPQHAHPHEAAPHQPQHAHPHEAAPHQPQHAHPHEEGSAADSNSSDQT